ncbi:MAG: NAD(+) kinase [Betaproteobacteria bacterium]
MNGHSASPFVPRAIALIGKFFSPEIAEPLGRLAENLEARGATVFIERGTAEQVGRQVDLSRWTTCDFEDIGAHADLAIVLGGDGTMLNAARQLARHGVPLLGVNQGRLGFLTDIGRDDVLNYLDGLFGGQFKLESRMLLAAELVRADEVIAANIALNDVVVDKGAIGRMIELELSIDGEFIYNLRADGLILSTPTGSTAYSLSAGGPIVHPASGTIALVPMSPHSLTNRPILVDGRSEIAVRITSTTEPRAHFDGQATLDLRQGDIIRLRRGEHDICLLHPPDYSYFAMLRQKLHWSERPRH